MKKILICFLCSVMLLGLTGCKEKKNNNMEEYTIVDKMQEQKDLVCASALQEFYTDDNYSYYFSCMKDEYVVVRYKGGKEEKVSDALKNKKINISDLDKFNISYSKEEIKTNDYDGKSCEYIRTYRFIDYYDYDATVPSNFFIIVDQYQMDSPMIIELNNNFKNINFVKGENYEFTFKDIYHKINTTDGNAINKNTSIINIEHTDKGGMEQKQEPCILK